MLHERIRKLRLAKGMTLQQVGDVFGISRGSVSSWESGANTPDPRKLAKLADCLGSTVEYLVTGDSKVSEPNRFSMVEFQEWGQLGEIRNSSMAPELVTAIHIPLGPRAFATRYPGPTKLQAHFPSIPPGALIFVEPDIKPTNLNTVLMKSSKGNCWLSKANYSRGENVILEVIDDDGIVININSKELFFLGVVTEWRISDVLL